MGNFWDQPYIFDISVVFEWAEIKLEFNWLNKEKYCKFIRLISFPVSLGVKLLCDKENSR